MTLNAVNSFVTNTPHVPVGLLFPKGLAERQSIISEVKDSSRVHTRDIESHFQNWNPTQHKLDIQKFSDEFDTIFWLDSDAVVVCLLILFPSPLSLPSAHHTTVVQGFVRPSLGVPYFAMPGSLPEGPRVLQPPLPGCVERMAKGR